MLKGAMIARGGPPYVTYPGKAWDLLCQFPVWGPRIGGPWIFGLKQGLHCWYFCIGSCDYNTLIPIIERECAFGSVIHSDEWPAHSNLNAMGY